MYIILLFLYNFTCSYSFRIVLPFDAGLGTLYESALPHIQPASVQLAFINAFKRAHAPRH
jgi:hypothetical protein